MADIIKEMMKMMPEGKVSEAHYEAANIVFYTKDKEFFLDHGQVVREVVSAFKKRIEVRPDPSITLDQEEAAKIIREVMPAEAGVDQIKFDPHRSEVIIEADKPGLAIGKQGAVLREIREKTFWVPLVKRMPAIRSDIVENIREVVFQSSEYRKKFLDKVGHRIYDGWIRDKKSEWVRLTFLGAGRQVGRSCLFLQTPESRILLDCGIDVTSDADAYPYLEVPEFDINELDAVIISHSHIDHSGFVPYLFKFGYKGPVYMTAPTLDVSTLLMLDTVKIARAEGKDPIYTQEEIKEMVKHTIALPYECVMDITPDVRMTFYDSGHILGSAMIHLHIGNGLHNFLYTADMKYAKTGLLSAAHTQFPRVETLMIESTYGAKNNVLPNEREQNMNLRKIILDTIGRGGKILMPTLGSGRAQEIMVMVEDLVRTKAMEPIPVYVDGLVWDVTAIHTAYPEFLNTDIRKLIFHKDQNPFLSPIFKRVGSQKERLQVVEEGGPCVIIATSGMLAGGPSVEYLKHLASNPKNSIVFSCYQGEGTLGRRIQQGEREFSFKTSATKTEVVQLNMEVHRIEITNHSDRRQLMNFLAHINPKPKKVIVNHGENMRCLDLASSVHKIYRVETLAPRNLETVRLR